MRDRFVMNGYLWRIRFVGSNSPYLVDRTGQRTVATTDPSLRMIFLSNELHGSFLVRVLIHEIGHCALVSFGLLDDIFTIVRPQYRIQAEEWVCNFMADYGFRIVQAAYDVLGDDLWNVFFYELKRIIG